MTSPPLVEGMSPGSEERIRPKHVAWIPREGLASGRGKAMTCITYVSKGGTRLHVRQRSL